MSKPAPRRIKLTVSPDAEKYVSRDAPVGARRMAARGALPLEPIELATVLFILQHDADDQVKATATESLANIPPHLLDVVAAGPAHPALLSFLAKQHREHEPTLEKLALNPATDDLTVAFLATLPSRRVVEIVSQNQERMLRCEEIVEALGGNPLTGRATIDRILGFLGIDGPEEGHEADQLVDPEELTEAAAEEALRAILGDDLQNVVGALSKEGDDEISDEDLKGNLFAAVQKMTGGLQDVGAQAGATEGPLALMNLFRGFLVGYLGTTGELGWLSLLNVGMNAPPDPAGFVRSPIGGWRRDYGEFTLFSFQYEVLAAVAPQLRYEEAERAAQFRLRAGDLSNAQITPTINNVGYARTRETSRGNLRLLHALEQQLRVKREDCLSTAERLMNARLICPLGGEYQIGPTAGGVDVWTSTELAGAPNGGLFSTQAPQGFVSPPLNWFRGLDLDVEVAPEAISLHAEVIMQSPQ